MSMENLGEVSTNVMSIRIKMNSLNNEIIRFINSYKTDNDDSFFINCNNDLINSLNENTNKLNQYMDDLKVIKNNKDNEDYKNLIPVCLDNVHIFDKLIFTINNAIDIINDKNISANESKVELIDKLNNLLKIIDECVDFAENI
ncbi:hypothetical protein [Methanobrevibacter sp. DSM 116169]|uniref:hypothetical protein n=1 Tax=Methanobrevibacter sp. DSM 116169 TaxID=3242727 RepID=UPI0038FD32A8